MTNGNSSEFIQWRLEKNEKMKIMEGSARKTKVDHLQIKLELVEKDDNNCENSGANNNKEKKKKDEKKDNDEEKEEKKTRKVEKTIWEWKLVNTAKPLWQRK